jgi:hypothetical protein
VKSKAEAQKTEAWEEAQAEAQNQVEQAAQVEDQALKAQHPTER